jgi:hypothetical protein
MIQKLTEEEIDLAFDLSDHIRGLLDTTAQQQVMPLPVVILALCRVLTDTIVDPASHCSPEEARQRVHDSLDECIEMLLRAQRTAAARKAH